MSAQPRLSSTVLLIRDHPSLEVLMVKRHYEIDFASGALVFPGGKTSDDDTQADWSDYVDGDFSGQDLVARIGGVREVYEESGLLLARDKDNRGEGAPLVIEERVAHLDDFRAAVDRGELSFLKLMKENNLVLALDRLVPFAHWITPDMMPKRFDTHFYLAVAPEKQVATHDGRETTEAIWIDPTEALEQEKAGTATIIFPTRMNVEMLSREKACDAAIKAAQSRDVVTVLPVVSKNDAGEPVLKIPAEANYCVTEEPLQAIANVQK